MALTNGYSNWWGLEEFVRMCLAIKRLTTWILGSNYLLAAHTEILDGGYWTVISLRLNSSKLIKISRLFLFPSTSYNTVPYCFPCQVVTLVVESQNHHNQYQVDCWSVSWFGLHHLLQPFYKAPLWKASRDRIVACRDWTIATQN